MKPEYTLRDSTFFGWHSPGPLTRNGVTGQAGFLIFKKKFHAISPGNTHINQNPIVCQHRGIHCVLVLSWVLITSSSPDVFLVSPRKSRAWVSCGAVSYQGGNVHLQNGSKVSSWSPIALGDPTWVSSPHLNRLCRVSIQLGCSTQGFLEMCGVLFGTRLFREYLDRTYYCASFDVGWVLWRFGGHYFRGAAVCEILPCRKV